MRLLVFLCLVFVSCDREYLPVSLESKYEDLESDTTNYKSRDSERVIFEVYK